MMRRVALPLPDAPLGYRLGHFGIYRTNEALKWKRHWKMVHLPSGWTIGEQLKLWEAKRVIRYWQTLPFDWSKPKPLSGLNSQEIVAFRERLIDHYTTNRQNRNV